MPALLERLGPVKAEAFRVARRTVNLLRAGYAVSHYSALEPCGLIWIAVPEKGLDRVVGDLAAQMPVHQTMVVLCDCARSSRWPNPLCVAGARIASVNLMEETHESLFIGEGHPDTVRAVRRLFAREKRRLIEIRPASKAVYLAGVRMASDLLLPWIDAAVMSLRATGFSRAEATKASEALVSRVVRAYTTGGRKAWDKKSAAVAKRSIDRDVAALGDIDPKLAVLYAEGLRLAAAHFGRE
jgi:hypothetical protein